MLPVYLLVDTSDSMKGDPMKQVNDSVPEIMRTVITQPKIADNVRLDVIEFNSRADVILPMTDVRSITSAPQFEAKGSTNYVSACQTTRVQIDSDIAVIRAGGRRLYRPTVIMVTDGAPDPGDWKTAFRELVEEKPGRVHVNVVPFGVTNADRSVIEYLSKPQGYIMEPGWDISAALATLIPAIVGSIVASGSGGGLVLPNAIPGFTTVNNDIV